MTEPFTADPYLLRRGGVGVTRSGGHGQAAQKSAGSPKFCGKKDTGSIPQRGTAIYALEL
ncbi:hypothetical protein [Bradyrhizobium erythrophlei]|jgi:hypothetical protein|uniref:hypothetical protein n=1 Tax=Bradyrhizobium erythrophlei TaxID=1437360 RepID=UPI0012AB5A51|nr:hypothetical protein [Bradyrhizobium erythrophlei]